MASQTLCEKMQMTGREVNSLLGYLRIGSSDLENMAVVRSTLETVADELVEEFYQHILQFENLRCFLTGDEILARLSQTLRRYLITLGQGADTLDYFEHRLRIGFVHEGIGLGIKWYLGIYPFLSDCIARRLQHRFADDSARLIELLASVQKILSLDSLLAVETYHAASNQRLEDVLGEQYLSEQKLRETASRDGLTGILNRQSLMEAIEVEYLRSQRFSHDLCLLLVDLDQFKDINDQYGHRFGDFVLQRVVQLIGLVLRPSDIFGRFGGDEFLICLPRCHLREATMIADRIRLKVALGSFESGPHRTPVTLSIGVASAGEAINTGQLLDQADRAMYEGKRAGRNKAVVHARRSHPAKGSDGQARSARG